MLNTRWWVAGLVVAGVLWSIPAITSAHEHESSSGCTEKSEEVGDCRVPIPVHPEGKGDKCVEEIPFMRRNHMELILHKRNLTMRQGIRTPTHSLKECIKCHAKQRADGNYIPVNDPGQFCQSCHSYAGIQPDCFDCHATTPAVAPATKP
jgi:hypothetical protein